MSFAYDVKTELCTIPSAPCCKKAMLYGILLFGRAFSLHSLAVQTEHEGIAAIICRLTADIFGVMPQIKTGGRSGRVFTVVSLEGDAAGRLFRSFGYDEKTVSLRINLSNFEDEACQAAFLRGAFLSCGTLVEPEKDYHLEFASPHRHLTQDLAVFFSEHEMEPKLISRKGSYVVYFKESSQIEDVLTYIGAVSHSLQLMDIKIYKEIRNTANRVTNCETANIDKTVAAAAEQCEAIKKIIAENRFEDLSDDLKEAARLRLENPELSLRELAQTLKISRSGVFHRLKKLTEIANGEL